MRAVATMALVMAVSFIQVTPARAADHKAWVGRDIANNKVHWTLTKVSGDSWVLKENGKKFADCEATQVKGDFIELSMSGGGKVRVYDGKFQMTKPRTKTEWIDIARGKWSD
ncbi:MAG: hypothetical protein ACKO23_03110 [Gemmataceae bacterium]